MSGEGLGFASQCLIFWWHRGEYHDSLLALAEAEARAMVLEGAAGKKSAGQSAVKLGSFDLEFYGCIIETA